jgi:hypothetical protein
LSGQSPDDALCGRDKKSSKETFGLVKGDLTKLRSIIEKHALRLQSSPFIRSQNPDLSPGSLSMINAYVAGGPPTLAAEVQGV